MLKSRNKITVFNIASTIILQGLAFFSGPIFSGMLGTNNYGIAAVYLTWVQLATTVFPLQAGGTVALARVNYPLEDQPEYQSSVLTLSTILYACFSVITIIIIFLLRPKFSIPMPMVLFALTQGWGMYCVGFMNNKFTYEFKADKNFILSVLTSASTIALSIFLIRLFPSATNYWGRIIGQSVTYTAIGSVIFIYILLYGKKTYSREYWRFTLPIALPTVFHLLANLVLNQSDKVMLQNLISNSSAGVYALASTFGAVLYTIWTALNNSWVPFYYEYTRTGHIDEMKKHARNYIELFTVVAMGFILLSREVFHIYAKPNFWGGTDLIPLFAIGYYFVFLYSFPVNYEFYNKKTKIIAAGTTIAALSNIVLNYFLILRLGIQGAVIATAAAHGLQFLFHYINAKRIDPGKFPFVLKQFIPGFVAILVTSGLYWFTRDLLVVRWIAAGTLGIYILNRIIKRREIF